MDIASHAGLVTRELRSGERDGQPTRVAVASRSYPTDRADLWDAVTSPERVPRWFLPLSGDLRPGGRYQLEGNAGGTIETCEAPGSLAVTWEYGGQVSWLTVTLTEDGTGTTLELVHEAHVDPDLWSQFGPGAVGLGWDSALLGLGLHVETGEPVDPAFAASFNFSPEGRDFLRAAADGWRDAAVAAGEDPDAMQRAADGSYAAYTTAPEE